MAVIKYRDENGNLVAVGAGNHTHSPSDIGAADRVHGHTEATQETPGFMSKDDKQALDQAVQDIQTLDESLGFLVGNTPVGELLSSALAPINAALENKAEAIPGKQLSTEDYTTADKNKLAGLQNYELPTAGKDQLGGVKTSSTVSSTSGYTACPIISGIPYYKDTNTNTTNTAGSSDTSNKIFLIGATSQTSSSTTYSHDTAYVGTDGCLYSNSKKVSTEGHDHDTRYYTEDEIDTKLNDLIGNTPVSEQISDEISAATDSITAAAEKYTDAEMADHSGVMASYTVAGHMRAADKKKLDDLSTKMDGLAEVATTGSYNSLSNKPTIPEAYDHPSSHPASMITGLSTVAISGSYNDLDNKPTIPSYSNATQSAAGLMSKTDKKKLDGLATVATSGNYTDLSNKPAIPEAYSHPTDPGYKHIPAGGSSGQILRWSSSGTAVWDNENGIKYTCSTTDLTAGVSSLTTGQFYFVYE